MPDIILVVLYQVLECEIKDVWQQIGCIVRDQCLQRTALILTKKKHYDEIKEQRKKNRAKKEKQKQKCQAISKGTNEVAPPSKRQRSMVDGAVLVGMASEDGTNDISGDLSIELDRSHKDSEDESDSNSDDSELKTDGNDHEQTAAEKVSQDISAQGALTEEAIFPMPDEKIMEERRAVYLEAA